MTVTVMSVRQGREGGGENPLFTCTAAGEVERRQTALGWWVGGYLLPFSLHLVYLNKAM